MFFFTHLLTLFLLVDIVISDKLPPAAADTNILEEKEQRQPT